MIRYHVTADAPALRLWLLDDDGSLVNLTGYTFTVKVGSPGSAGLLSKSAGIVGAAGAGTEPTGTPNCVVTWSAGEIATLPAGRYAATITATSGGLDRVWQFDFEVLAVVT
jgi:hypothetical protein